LGYSVAKPLFLSFARTGKQATGILGTIMQVRITVLIIIMKAMKAHNASDTCGEWAQVPTPLN